MATAVRVVFNGRAGDSSMGADKLETLLKNAGHEPVMHLPDDGKLGNFLKGSMKMAVAAGGDGTVGKVARALAGRDIPIAVLPLGTANNIAGSLGVPLDVEAAIQAWSVSDVVVYDLGVADGPWGERPFLEGFGVGAFADLISAVHAEETGDRLAALRQARQRIADSIAEAPDRVVSLTVDGEESSLHALMVEALNIGLLGPRLRLAPDADPHDGKFELVVVRPGDRQAMVDWLLHQSPQHAPPALMTRRFTRLDVRWAEGAARFDGKHWLAPAREKGPFTARIAIQPGGVRFLIPRQTKAA